MLASLFFRHFHADRLREILHRVDEAKAPVFHEETDGGAVCSAAEAVIELLCRAHRERRRLFRMKRAAGGVIRPGAFQLHIAVDDFDDVDAVEQVLDELLRDQTLRRVLTRADTLAMSARPASLRLRMAI